MRYCQADLDLLIGWKYEFDVKVRRIKTKSNYWKLYEISIRRRIWTFADDVIIEEAEEERRCFVGNI